MRARPWVHLGVLGALLLHAALCAASLTNQSLASPTTNERAPSTTYRLGVTRRQSVADLRDAVQYWRAYVERHASVLPASTDALGMLCTFLATTAGRPIARPASRLLRIQPDEVFGEDENVFFAMDEENAPQIDVDMERMRSALSFSSLVRTHLDEEVALATGRSDATDDQQVVEVRPRAKAVCLSPPPEVTLETIRFLSASTDNGIVVRDESRSTSETPGLQDTLVLEATIAAIRRDPDVFPLLLDTLLAPDRTGAEHYARVLAHVVVAGREDLVPRVIAHARRRSIPLGEDAVVLDTAAYGAWAAALVALAAAGHAATLATTLGAADSPFGALPVAGAAASQVLAEYRAAPHMYAGAEDALLGLVGRVSLADTVAEMVDACIVALRGLSGDDGAAASDVHGCAFARAALYRHRLLTLMDDAHAASLRGATGALPELSDDALVVLAILDAVPQAVAVDSLPSMAALDWPASRSVLVALGFAAPLGVTVQQEVTADLVFSVTQSPAESLRGLRSRFRMPRAERLRRVSAQDVACDKCAVCLCALFDATDTEAWGQFTVLGDDSNSSSLATSPEALSFRLDNSKTSTKQAVSSPSDMVAVGTFFSPGTTPECASVLGRFSDVSSPGRPSNEISALVMLPCGHVYHEECAYSLVRDRPACALCNATI